MKGAGLYQISIYNILIGRLIIERNETEARRVLDEEMLAAGVKPYHRTRSYSTRRLGL